MTQALRSDARRPAASQTRGGQCLFVQSRGVVRSQPSNHPATGDVATQATLAEPYRGLRAAVPTHHTHIPQAERKRYGLEGERIACEDVIGLVCFYNGSVDSLCVRLSFLGLVGPAFASRVVGLHAGRKLAMAGLEMKLVKMLTCPW